MCNRGRYWGIAALAVALSAAVVTPPQAGTSSEGETAGVREFMERAGGPPAGVNTVDGVVSQVFADRHMIALIELPPGHVDRMPKGDNPAPTPEEIAILKWWINQGADGTKTVKELAATPEITAAIATMAPAVAANPDATTAVAPATPAAGPNAALAAAVAALTEEFPGAVTFESRESSAVTLNAASLRGTLDDAAFAKFAPVVPYLVTADLTASKLTDQGVSDLAAAKNLRLVRLAETPVTDAAIETLLKLPALESINLYGTKVTDAGVLKLAALPKLKRLYLWQTSVTPAAVATLQEKLPNCEIVTGT